MTDPIFRREPEVPDDIDAPRGSFVEAEPVPDDAVRARSVPYLEVLA